MGGLDEANEPLLEATGHTEKTVVEIIPDGGEPTNEVVDHKESMPGAIDKRYITRFKETTSCGLRVHTMLSLVLFCFCILCFVGGNVCRSLFTEPGVELGLFQTLGILLMVKVMLCISPLCLPSLQLYFLSERQLFLLFLFDGMITTAIILLIVTSTVWLVSHRAMNNLHFSSDNTTVEDRFVNMTNLEYPDYGIKICSKIVFMLPTYAMAGVLISIVALIIGGFIAGLRYTYSNIHVIMEALE